MDLYAIGRKYSNEQIKSFNYDTPDGQVHIHPEYIGNISGDKDDDQMEISENDSAGSDEGHYTNNIYEKHTNIEVDKDGTTNYSMHTEDTKKNIEHEEGRELPEKHRKHKFTGSISKRKRRMEDMDPNQDIPEEIQRGTKHKKGARRIPRREQNATRRQNNETDELSIHELQKD